MDQSRADFLDECTEQTLLRLASRLEAHDEFKVDLTSHAAAMRSVFVTALAMNVFYEAQRQAGMDARDIGSLHRMFILLIGQRVMRVVDRTLKELIENKCTALDTDQIPFDCDPTQSLN